MAFRPFSSGANGAWINPAAGNAFKALADGYKGLSKGLDQKAQAAAHQQIVEPALADGAHPSTQAFISGDMLHVGVPLDHPDAAAVADLEYGTLTEPAGGHIRRSMRANGEASFTDFQERLVE